MTPEDEEAMARFLGDGNAKFNKFNSKLQPLRDDLISEYEERIPDFPWIREPWDELERAKKLSNYDLVYQWITNYTNYAKSRHDIMDHLEEMDPEDLELMGESGLKELCDQHLKAELDRRATK